MYLIKIFSAQSYLAEKEDNCKVLTSLMEAVNYLLVYQDGSNGRLLITMVNNKEMLLGLENIETFSLPNTRDEEAKQKVEHEEEKKEEQEGKDEPKEGEEQKQQMVEVEHEPAQLSEGTKKEESKE